MKKKIFQIFLHFLLMNCIQKMGVASLNPSVKKPCNLNHFIWLTIPNFELLVQNVVYFAVSLKLFMHVSCPESRPVINPEIAARKHKKFRVKNCGFKPCRSSSLPMWKLISIHCFTAAPLLYTTE